MGIFQFFFLNHSGAASSLLTCVGNQWVYLLQAGSTNLVMVVCCSFGEVCLIGPCRITHCETAPPTWLCRLRTSRTWCFSLFSPLAAPETTQVPPLECREAGETVEFYLNFPVRNIYFPLPCPHPRPSAPHRPGVSCPSPSCIVSRPASTVSARRAHRKWARSLPPIFRRRARRELILELISPEVFTQRAVCCNIISDATVKCSI